MADTIYIGEIVGRDKIVTDGSGESSETIQAIINAKLAAKAAEAEREATEEAEAAASGRVVDSGVTIIAGGNAFIGGNVYAKDKVDGNAGTKR